MSHELVQVATTTADQPTATTLARLVLESRLAACVQISGPITSHYWWQGVLESATEWRLLIKTHATLMGPLEALLLQHHPYEQPEIIATAAEHVTAGYLQWLKSELNVP